jgi:hypothetical protein
MTPPDCLKALLDVLILWHGKDKQLIVQELRSLPNCPQQAFDSDCEYGIGKKKRKLFKHIPFSMILALESNDNCTRIVNHKNEENIIRQGYCAIFRGDYLHADASYTIFNRRLFVSVIL